MEVSAEVQEPSQLQACARALCYVGLCLTLLCWVAQVEVGEDKQARQVQAGRGPGSAAATRTIRGDSGAVPGYTQTMVAQQPSKAPSFAPATGSAQCAEPPQSAGCS
eukprot:1836064-Rhodomonas_salina.1